MVDKVATTNQFALVDPLPKSFITGLLPNSTSNLCSCLNMGFV